MPLPPKKGVPVWAWVLIGCCCGAPILLVPILAAILFPVFSQARAKARATTCLSNTKQAGLAILMYQQDYDERYPPASQWMTVTDPYVKNESVYRCPEVRSNGPNAYGYAYNSNLNLAPMDKVADPRDTAVLWDSTNLKKSASDTLQSLPIPGRHSGGNSIGLADGHSRWWPTSDPPPSATLSGK
jgi:prepilin-type processing-associated H-X9-DG protein